MNAGNGKNHEQCCASCKYAHEMTDQGQCRRFPPILQQTIMRPVGNPVALPNGQQVVPQMQTQSMYSWPAVKANGWCGEWKAKNES